MMALACALASSAACAPHPLAPSDASENDGGDAHIAASDGADASLLDGSVEIASITSARIRVFVPGSAGGDIDLEDGASVQGGSRAYRGVVFHVPSITVGGVVFHDRIDPSWFTLVSETPDTCVVGMTDGNIVNGVRNPPRIPIARLIEDGVCSVRVEAPLANGGAGLRRRVSVTFTRVDRWMEPPP